LVDESLTEHGVHQIGQALGQKIVTEGLVRCVVGRDGRPYEGSWEEIVRGMRDATPGQAQRSLEEFMQAEARRGFALTGILIPTRDAESFLRASADAGLLRILH
jgi:hypothetical protein